MDGLCEAPTAGVELSVVLSTFNRARRLHACLEALSRQTQPPEDFEVVVVVDGSTDETRQVLAELQPPFVLRVLHQENRGQCAALNRGIESARGRTCLIIDDDIIAAPELISEHVRLHRERSGVVGIGQLTLTQPASADWFARCFARGWSDQYSRLNQGAEPGWQDCYGGNMSVERAVLREVGGFATDLLRGYDVELAYRLQRRGLTFAYLRDAVGIQDERKGFAELALDGERAGQASVALCEREPSLLPDLLGSFNEASCRKVLLRRLLLQLRVPPRLLGALGPLLGRSRRAYSWYSFVHNYCFWRGVRRALPDRETWRRLTNGVPILLYHAFAERGAASSRFVISGERFARQLALLERLRYHVLSLRQFMELRRRHEPPPARAVVITLDDGYRDNLHVAYPALRRYDFPAVIFLVSGYVGCSNRWDRSGELAGRPLLSWREIRAMAADGMEFAPHSETHRMLNSLTPGETEAEVRRSKAAVEAELGVRVTAFAYPYGEYDAETVRAVERTGLEVAFSVDEGLNSPGTAPYALRRIEIPGTTPLWRFLFALWFGRLRL